MHEVDVDAAVVAFVFWGSFGVAHACRLALRENNGFCERLFAKSAKNRLPVEN